MLKNEKTPQNQHFTSNYYQNENQNSESNQKLSNVNKINKFPVSKPVKKSPNIINNTTNTTNLSKQNSALNKIKTNQLLLTDFKTRNLKN